MTAHTSVSLAAPFPYFGGKTSHAARIASLLPDHGHYVEPFAGSLAVLLAKPRSRMETVNDLDGDLMTFWRVLRDQPEVLARACALTPHSRAEHDDAYNLDCTDDIERARRVWVVLTQGRAGTMRRTGWRFYRDPAGSTYSMPACLNAYANRLELAAERIAGVSLECRDALAVIAEYGAHSDVLLYCDPPYLGSTRAANYKHEMRGDGDHEALLSTLLDCEASVVLSGYASDLYDEALAGWSRVDFDAWTGNGIAVGSDKTDGNRKEVVWSNRPLPIQDVLDFEAS